MEHATSFEISDQLITQAYGKLKTCGNCLGLKVRDFTSVEQDLDNLLHKLHSRLVSGSYSPPAKRGLDLMDRVAQMAVALTVEQQTGLPLDFGCRDSIALEWVQLVRDRCLEIPWVVEITTSNVFQRVAAIELFRVTLAKPLPKWVKLTIGRWQEGFPGWRNSRPGKRRANVSPYPVLQILLERNFLFEVFDQWIAAAFPLVRKEVYGGKIICHCSSREEAKAVHLQLCTRLKQFDLAVNEKQARIIYCKTAQRTTPFENIQFEFLGYSFQPKLQRKQGGERRLSFQPAISREAKKEIGDRIRKWPNGYWVQLTLEQIAQQVNPDIQEWISYYGRYTPGELKRVLMLVNWKLARWIQNKYKPYRRRKERSMSRLYELSMQHPQLFAHWRWGVLPLAPKNMKSPKKTG